MTINRDELLGRAYEEFIASGKYSDMYIKNKFGRNTDIDTSTTPEDIWDGGGLYTGFPTGSAETIEVFSDNANDTSAGTGARTVKIYGLDDNYDLIEETLTMNGVTAVTSANSYKRMFRAYVVTAGSNETNVGKLTFRHSTTTSNVFAIILADGGQTNQTNYTIPAGYTGYFKYLISSLLDNTSNSATMAIYFKGNGEATRFIYPFILNNNQQYKWTPYGGVQIPEKTDIMLRCLNVTNNNADIVVKYDLLVEKN